jgi:hypothetical protein
VSEDVVVTLRKVLHNSGPDGPVDVSISASASAPPDCEATPGPGNPTSASLPVSANVVIDETWTIHCDARSQHVFSFENHIEDPAVVDPVPGNNFASTQLAVDVWDQADLSMISQHWDRDTIPVGENVPITVRTVVRNNGPLTEVAALLEIDASAPTGCSISLESHQGEFPNLPVDVDIEHNAPFTIRCDEPGWHTFSFDNMMRVDMQHVRDPDAGNNTLHTELTVTAS